METQLLLYYSHVDQSLEAVHHSSPHVRTLSEQVCTHSVQLQGTTQEVRRFRKNKCVLFETLRNWLECEQGFGSGPSNPGHSKLPLHAEPFQMFVEACHMDLIYHCEITFFKIGGGGGPTWLFRCRVTAMFRGIMGSVPRCALTTGTWHLAKGLRGARVWRSTHSSFGLRESQDERRKRFQFTQVKECFCSFHKIFVPRSVLHI